MFLNALKNNDFISYFLYLLLAVGFAISLFHTEVLVTDFSFLVFPQKLDNSVFLYRVIFYLLWLASAFWVNRLLVKYKILEMKGGLAVFLYLLLSFTFWNKSISIEIILSILFLFFLLEQLMIIYQNQGRLYLSMNLGLLFGCASFFYFPLILLAPWVVFSLSEYKTLKWRDFIYVLIGLAIPFYLYSVWQFFSDVPNLFWNKNIISFKIPHRLLLQFQNFDLSALTILFLLLIVFNAYSKKRTQTLKNRIFYVVILWLFLGAVFLCFFGAESMVELSFFLFPLTFLGATYFDSFKRKWLFDIFVATFFILYFIQ